MAGGRENLRPFQKGHPGGPGRPKGGHIDWCEDFADGEGKDLLMSWARQKKNGKVALQALTLIFAYGKGKPRETLKVEGMGELAAKLEAARQRAGI